MDLQFSGEIWFWRGPAPWHFVTVPDEQCAAIEAAAALVTYGWGMIPVSARIGATGWTTSLWPKDGRYIVPVKTSVRRAEGLDLGDTVTVLLTVDT
ncbi:hypothetical protein Cs7R123_11500 [Catellatospora sp. TT07R-123]|uniref:DUF1905 domain-containing protein n=1 Tax=Catellatospora sp. TT07R-123 TaxID=2733863 RepID=UPI001B2481CA|nr:DUF1905 domain-containing protein [Catellatospora sp. TT07R-123]GHJ43808.1 hypothetical protein Cs7R123_11500 [Catellatospora sp. TT07R-123]